MAQLWIRIYSKKCLSNFGLVLINATPRKACKTTKMMELKVKMQWKMLKLFLSIEYIFLNLN
jgi:hypothetical protein